MQANLPPKDCEIKVQTTAQKLALTDSFDISVENCVDIDLPLTYRYTYYLSKKRFNEDITSGKTLNLESMTDYITDNTFKTPLPLSDGESGEIIF